MKEQEFYALIQKIENNTYTDNKLDLFISEFDEERFEERLTDDKITLLANALKKNFYITKIDLGGNDIGDQGAIALSTVGTLKELDLSENNIGLEGAKALANSSLIKLSLFVNDESPCETGDTKYNQFLSMVNAFIDNKTIVDLDLHLHCYHIPAEMVAQLIGRNNTIRTLFFKGDFSDETIQFIEHNKTLETLYIPENSLTDKGAEYISRNTSLKALRINNSDITDIGAKLLSTHTNLQELLLHDSNITSKGAEYFIGSKLKEVTLIYNLKDCMSREELYTFHSAFEKGKFLCDHPEMTFIIDNDDHKEVFALDNMDGQHIELSGDLDNLDQ